LGTVFALLAAAGTAEAQEPLALERAVELAATRNERAKIADLNVAVSSAAVQRAVGAFLPSLNVNANDTQRPDDIVRAGTPSNIANASATLSQPIFNATAFPLLGQARQNHDAQIAQSLDDKRVLAFDAARAFIAALQSEAVLQAAQQKLESSKANLGDTQARADAQLSSTNDVTRSEIEVAASQRELELDKGALTLAYLQLAFTINSPITGALSPPALLLQSARNAPPAPEALIRTALARRPDLVAKKHTALGAHDFAQEPLLRLVPTVSATGSFSLTSNLPTVMGVTARPNDEFLGLTVGWQIFDAGVRYADKRSRDASANIADLNTDVLVRSIDIQVRSAIVTLESQQAALAASERSMIAARKSSAETAILYRQGLAKAIELVDAAEQRFLAEVSYATAEYSVALAYLGLRQAIGLDPLGEEIH
jgi:outer membrane protein TolC